MARIGFESSQFATDYELIRYVGRSAEVFNYKMNRSINKNVMLGLEPKLFSMSPKDHLRVVKMLLRQVLNLITVDGQFVLTVAKGILSYVSNLGGKAIRGTARLLGFGSSDNSDLKKKAKKRLEYTKGRLKERGTTDPQTQQRGDMPIISELSSKVQSCSVGEDGFSTQLCYVFSINDPQFGADISFFTEVTTAADGSKTAKMYTTFKGTVELFDHLQDANAVSVEYDSLSRYQRHLPKGLRAYAGPFTAFKSISEAYWRHVFHIRHALFEDPKMTRVRLVISGHSFGAATCTFAYLDAIDSYYEDLGPVTCYTLGSPKVANAALHDYALERSRETGSALYRLWGENDAAPSLPPNLPGLLMYYPIGYSVNVGSWEDEVISTGRPYKLGLVNIMMSPVKYGTNLLNHMDYAGIDFGNGMWLQMRPFVVAARNKEISNSLPEDVRVAIDTENNELGRVAGLRGAQSDKEREAVNARADAFAARLAVLAEKTDGDTEMTVEESTAHIQEAAKIASSVLGPDGVVVEGFEESSAKFSANGEASPSLEDYRTCHYETCDELLSDDPRMVALWAKVGVADVDELACLMAYAMDTERGRAASASR
jgi:hypothetical protein